MAILAALLIVMLLGGALQYGARVLWEHVHPAPAKEPATKCAKRPVFPPPLPRSDWEDEDEDTGRYRRDPDEDFDFETDGVKVRWKRRR